MGLASVSDGRRRNLERVMLDNDVARLCNVHGWGTSDGFYVQPERIGVRVNH